MPLRRRSGAGADGLLEELTGGMKVVFAGIDQTERIEHLRGHKMLGATQVEGIVQGGEGIVEASQVVARKPR